MKRGRKARGFNTHKVDKELDKLEKHGKLYLGPSMADLPWPISMSILLRLPTKRLLVCRCVCKTWRNIISDPQFAKLHFSKAEAFPLVRSLSPTHISRNLYLVEPPEHSSGFDLRDCCDCYGHSSSEPHFHMKLETKLKIPLRNAELVMNSEGDVNVSSNSKGGVKRKRCIKLRPKEHKLNLVNSCNGFLCLSEPSRNDPVVVCNPITGEFITLPVVTPADESFGKSFSDCGLGFSRKTNQYKETFRPVPPPPLRRGMISWENMKNMSLGVLRHKLCICQHDSLDFKIRIWVMKKYGVRESWRKVFRIDTATEESRWLRGVYKPISYLRSGGVLFFHRLANAVVYYNAKREFSSLNFLKVLGVKSKYEAIAYTPSFISLHNAVMGDNLAMMNVTSRCAGLKLLGETKALFLIEEDEDKDSDFNLSSDPDDDTTD
ncbi:hypothetical protein RHMOL_Rhmol07G0076900 [Rhododendron molle]|uniref:Uncharacterized protein n=1 Tax=Rhododendron molle TaxID=49168 RepID=A0ACC0MZ92_RHOML|nr:hypothetical protein RHMOL_Rhmol07G0076900 [Rhododendron molle]